VEDHDLEVYLKAYDDIVNENLITCVIEKFPLDLDSKQLTFFLQLLMRHSALPPHALISKITQSVRLVYPQKHNPLLEAFKQAGHSRHPSFQPDFRIIRKF
jgi:hypothetical protein